MGDWGVTVWGEMCAELFVGENGGLFEAVHTFANFKETIAAGVEVVLGEAVFLNDFRGQMPTMNLHILVHSHGGAEEKIFDVACAVAGTSCGIRDDTIDVQFGVCNTDCRGTYVLIGVEAIPANGHADPVNL